MSTPRRNGFKWAITEINTLQREYELLELDIQQIAAKHERTVESILYKLYNERFIEEFIVARGYPEYDNKNNKNNSFQTVDNCYAESEDNSEHDIVEPYISSDTHTYTHENMVLSQLENRVTAMEDTLNDVKYIITKLLKGTTIKKYKKIRKGEKICNSFY
jgi:hypothetical protein